MDTKFKKILKGYCYKTIRKVDNPLLKNTKHDGIFCIQYYNRLNKYHRDKGPAIIHSDNHKQWWVNGEFRRTK